MERDLLRQALGFHGPTLLPMLRAEQHDNPDFRGLLPPGGAAALETPPSRKERGFDNIEIQHFIAKKADLLFSHSWKTSVPTTTEANEENEDYYALMPPLEQFMDVPSTERRELFFRDIERGDIVIGRISSIREFGFFMVLFCLRSGVIREIADLEITALCPLRDVPSQSNHGDPLSYYQIAAIKDIDRYHEKLTVSLHSSALSPSLASIKLGVISSEDLPLHYRRSVATASGLETYEKVLHHSLGFANPAVVEFLVGKLGLNDSNPPSLMRGLQSKNFNEEDFAVALRKRQSASWALKCVKIGVDYFKEGRHVDAMNEYNKALEIDAQNVEALVARGALYATKGSLNKAIDDFEVALENCPTHRNARKYLCQTLVERGGQLEEEEKLLNAESYYKKALNIDETFQEAEDALLKLRKQIQKSLEMREKQVAKEERQKEKKIETSVEKLRKLLKEEKRLKKKRKRSTSSSSSSSCDSSSNESASSSSSDKKKRKKRNRNQSESSRSSKKHTSRSSSHPSRKDDCCSPPANTSASFLNQKHEMEKLLGRHDRLAYQKPEVRNRERESSLSRTSADDDPYGGRSEDSRDFYSSSKTQASGNKPEKQGKSDRVSSNRRESTGSYCRKADDRNKTNDSGKLERELGRKERYQKHSPSQTKYSTSPTGSDYSTKSAENYKQYTSKWINEPSRYSADNRPELTWIRSKREHNSREREAIKPKELDEEATLNGKGQSESGGRKNLPQNLLNIFNQIAEFEREKGNKPKNQ
ncbi:hypothetical protein JD844_007662 [Phrynosoma platyrhinos]|uniref:Tetratricopeptide repeat protein 14 n=1 Tax=Phrynosoma platyrhinos TaxID=52577 RepID=A0ABQ7T3L6_PHRPL|nr:hypothetical protein JD844_007662 [Phrynosoma platyrhinos]